MTGPLALLVMLATVLTLVLGGQSHGFRPGLARTSIRKTSGPNLATMLAVVGMASLVLEAGNLPLLNSIPGVGPLLAGLVVVLIIGLVVDRGTTDIILAVLGIGLLLMTLGASGAITLGVLLALMWWLLAVARGFFG